MAMEIAKTGILLAPEDITKVLEEGPEQPLYGDALAAARHYTHEHQDVARASLEQGVTFLTSYLKGHAWYEFVRRQTTRGNLQWVRGLLQTLSSLETASDKSTSELFWRAYQHNDYEQTEVSAETPSIEFAFEQTADILAFFKREVLRNRRRSEKARDRILGMMPEFDFHQLEAQLAVGEPPYPDMDFLELRLGYRQYNFLNDRNDYSLGAQDERLYRGYIDRLTVLPLASNVPALPAPKEETDILQRDMVIL